VESIVCSMCSNCSESCSIIWGSEYLHGRGAIGVWAPKGMSAGIAGLKGDGREPGGSVTDLEDGGGKPIETMLKPKCFRGY
jgi:hypothetical protein